MVPPDAVIGGKTYAEWSGAWWQWVMAIPTNENPLNQTGEVDCSFEQAGEVWFLVGTVGGEAVRSCEVPTDVYLHFPAVSVFAWEPDFANEEEGRALLDGIMDTASEVVVEVDGVAVENIDAHRLQSTLFEFTAAEDNIFGIPEPYTRLGLDDGYWVILEPLSVGEHTLHFQGTVTHELISFEVDATYQLTVTEQTSSVALDHLGAQPVPGAPLWLVLGLLLVPGLLWKVRTTFQQR